jgi:hypothetical protein
MVRLASFLVLIFAIWAVDTLGSGPKRVEAQLICQYRVEMVPTVPYVYVEGYACSQAFHSFSWNTKAWTRTFYSNGSPQTQYEVATSVYGYDRCGTGAWVWQTSDYVQAYNTWWSNWADDTGSYLNCDEFNPHQYRIHTWHYHRPTSGSFMSQVFGGYWYH